MNKKIIIQEKLTIWREFSVDVPNGMDEKEFIEQLKKTDPTANHYENNGVEYMDDTDEPIEVEYRKDDYTLINTHKF
jgi:hypothetical protein